MNPQGQASRPGIPGRWDHRKRDLGIAIWVAFLAACAGTFLVFAVLDPDALNDAWVPGWDMGPRLVYSLGFAFLFFVSVLASGLTVFMIRTGPRRGHYRGKGRRHAPEVRDDVADNPDLQLDPGEWREP